MDCTLGNYRGSEGLANVTGPCAPGYFCLRGNSQPNPIGGLVDMKKYDDYFFFCIEIFIVLNLVIFGGFFWLWFYLGFFIVTIDSKLIDEMTKIGVKVCKIDINQQLEILRWI